MKKLLLILCLLILSAICVYAQNIDPELLKRAEAGDAEAQYSIGWDFRDAKDYQNAFEWYTKAANQGNSSAQTDLGFMYLNGLGTKQDYTKAIEWYTKAAEQGNLYAQYDLSSIYSNGQGVKQDYKKASELLTKSADQGNSYAQYQLGKMYYNGQGVQQSYRKAFEWYQKAAYLGHTAAQKNLGVMLVGSQLQPPDDVTGCAWFYVANDSEYSAVCDAKLTSNQMTRALNLREEILKQIK